MTDLKFEQKRSLSRFEAADQLSALAAMLREGGEADVALGAGTLSLRIPDDLRSEIEVEVDDGQIELEIELTWSTTAAKTAPSRTAAVPERSREKAPARKTAPAAKAGRSGAGTSRSKSAKRSAAKAT
ncbi:amphi-Trp domain-containing protein [Streptomyces sp. NPDC058701]|uniref:amphi-Trp domain-containing protein n=1 Tax=Streptomyces sp. NPDC058701 TaxID=3346608 RepID=UPI0036579ADE